MSKLTAMFVSGLLVSLAMIFLCLAPTVGLAKISRDLCRYYNKTNHVTVISNLLFDADSMTNVKRLVVSSPKLCPSK